VTDPEADSIRNWYDPACALDRAFDTLTTVLGMLSIAELPSVALDSLFPDVPKVSAIYFLRSPNRHATLRGKNPNPKRPRRRNGLFYIGKAVNLQARWIAGRANWGGGWRDINVHEKAEQAIALGDIRLHWWECERRHLYIAESVLIQIYQPPWNSNIW
jgi:hypothetical protein